MQEGVETAPAGARTVTKEHDHPRLAQGVGQAAIRSERDDRGILNRMAGLAPTPADRLLDAQGRPYFLWDEDTRVEEFRERLRDPDPAVRAYYVGKLMRQAKPDDVFTFVTLREIEEQLPAVEPYLGRSRPFWLWILERWRTMPRGTR